MTRLGVDPATARKLSTAGEGKDEKGKPLKDGLSGPVADKFAKDHAQDVTLTEDKQRLLLLWLLSEYEKDVRKAVKIKLSQDEFDALLSFDFSRGPGSLEHVVLLLNTGRRAEAISLLRHFDDHLGAGFASRRQVEADMMLGSGQTGTGTKETSP